MISFLRMRLAGALATIFGASLISFILLRVLPGDPVRLIAGPLASEQALEGVRRQLGIDLPLPVQYARYIGGFVTGDWGFSFTAGGPVREVFASRIAATAELALFAFVIAFTAALILALLATYRRNRIIDGFVRVISTFGLGTPQFWLAMILLIVFFEQLNLFPGPSGRLDASTLAPPRVTGLLTVDSLLAGRWDAFSQAIEHLILPALSLGFVPFAFLVRLLRANLLEMSREPFIVVVRSKGIGYWATHTRHVLPNAFLPTLTASGLILAELLTGSVLVEKVFAWPGIGALVVDSILRQDYAVVQSFILLTAVLYVGVSFLVDMLYGVIDPRTRNPVSQRG
ncbi:MAG: ABC transporter permease [Anaerolineae bacterium]|nr:ABC transporter permease [Anaerolineae bacterium]